jgi:hypothetical protein
MRFDIRIPIFKKLRADDLYPDRKYTLPFPEVDLLHKSKLIPSSRSWIKTNE